MPYYDYNYPEQQTLLKRFPWLIYLFILVVFGISTPYYYLTFGYGAEATATFAGGAVELGAAKLGGTNPIRQATLFTLVIFAFIHFSSRKQNLLQVHGLLGWLILFYVIWSVSSIAWSDDRFFTAKRVGILVFMFLGALAFSERLSSRQIINLVFFVTAITLFAGIIYDIYYGGFHPATGRFGGGLHPIQQGWNCGLLAISALTLYKMSTRRRLFYLSVAFIALFFTYICRSRMPTAAAFVGFTVLGSLIIMKRHQFEIVFGLIVLGCVLYFALGEEFQGGQAVSAGRGFSWSGRMELWTELMRYAYHRPLLGYGYNSIISPKYVIVFVEEAGWFAPSTHSGYMEALLGLGFIGGIAFVMMLLLAAIRAFLTYLSNPIPENAFVVAFFTWLCSCLYTESVVIVRPIFPAFLSLMLLIRVGFVKQERNESEFPSY